MPGLAALRYRNPEIPLHLEISERIVNKCLPSLISAKYVVEHVFL